MALTITLIGYGKLASHFASAFFNADEVTLVQVYNRTLDRIAHLRGQCAITDSLAQLKPTDVTIICVPDSVIVDMSSQLKVHDTSLVVHTSGACPMNELKSAGRKGVFYPLQSFSVDKVIDFSTVPFCLEAEKETDLMMLERIVNAIGSKSYRIDSQQRQALHVSAVFANNFSNHLFGIAEQICAEHDVPFEILHPIILETAQKIQTLSPADAQTGPAIRQDTATMDRHLTMLTPEQQAIYQLLSASISRSVTDS